MWTKLMSHRTFICLYIKSVSRYILNFIFCFSMFAKQQVYSLPIHLLFCQKPSLFQIRSSGDVFGFSSRSSFTLLPQNEFIPLRMCRVALCIVFHPQSPLYSIQLQMNLHQPWHFQILPVCPNAACDQYFNCTFRILAWCYLLVILYSLYPFNLMAGFPAFYCILFSTRMASTILFALFAITTTNRCEFF